MSLRIGRVQFQRPPIRGHGVDESILPEQRNAQIIVSFRVAGAMRDGLLIFRDGIIESIPSAQRQSEVVVCLGVAR